jgi:transketolase
MSKELRQIFAECVIEEMKKNDKIVVLDADLSKANGTVPIREAFPDRHINVGIAEQNMGSVAAGMASYGFIPIITTFATFASRRICDQIAISICYAKQNVKIVGTDPGVTSELNGGTHCAVEDIGVLRSIPNILICEPADETELRKILPEIIKYNGPVYMRLYRKVAAPVYDESYQFDLMKANVVKKGKDVTIVSSGIMVNEALKAGEILAAENIDCEVINLHTIKPIDAETVVNSAKKTGVIVTCENHNYIGGVRSAVAEAITMEYPVPVVPVGIQDRVGEVGLLDYLKSRFNLTSDDIVAAVKKAITMKKA